MTNAIISILTITAIVWLVNKILSITICPMCAGVFLTWVWLLGTYNLGYQVDILIPAILMGGTVVGVMYKLEKKFSNSSSGILLFWKVLFVSAGFVAMYGILKQLWAVSVVAIAFLLITLISMQKTGIRDGVNSNLEEKMKDCC